MVGRKRKSGARQPDGRLRQPSRKEREEARKRKEFGEKHVVLAQPHRRGDADQRCGSAFGRFCKRCAVNAAGETAAAEYEGLVRRWRAARGVPTHLRLGLGGTGEGPSEASVRVWGARILRYDRAMAQASFEGWLALKQMLLMDYDIGLDQAPAALLALAALIEATGARGGRANPHPNPLPQAGEGAPTLLP